MTDMCPCCGYNLARDVALAGGPWEISLSQCLYKGKRVPLSPAEVGVLYGIAKAKGRPIKAEVLAARVSDSEKGFNLANVYLCRMRKKLPAIPFENVPRVGVRWVAEPLMASA